MANSQTVRTQFSVEYMGDGEKSGGTYSFSNLKHTASNEQIDGTARAITDLQAKTAKRFFKVVSSELSE